MVKFNPGTECILRPMQRPGRPAEKNYQYGIPDDYMGKTCTVIKLAQPDHPYGTEYMVEMAALNDYDRREYGETVRWYAFEPMLEQSGGPW